MIPNALFFLIFPLSLQWWIPGLVDFVAHLWLLLQELVDAFAKEAQLRSDCGSFAQAAAWELRVSCRT
jgi:hypothetical protein